MDSILYLQHDYSLPFLEDVVEIENILNNEVVSSCYGSANKIIYIFNLVWLVNSWL